MDKDKFNKAIEINNKIEEYKDHKMALENSNIKYGGGLIFTYNTYSLRRSKPESPSGYCI